MYKPDDKMGAHCSSMGHVLSRVSVEVLWVVEETQHQPVRFLFLHGEDVGVLACTRADELLEESAEFAESRVFGSVCVPQAAVPSHSVTYIQERSRDGSVRLGL